MLFTVQLPRGHLKLIELSVGLEAVKGKIKLPQLSRFDALPVPTGPGETVAGSLSEGAQRRAL